MAEVSFLREEEVTCRLFRDIAYQSEQLEEELAESGILLVGERAKTAALGKAADRHRLCKPQAGFWSRRDVGEDSRWACRQDLRAKITVYTYVFLVNRLMGRPQGRIKDL
jgi:hypothetical protein